MGTSGCYELLSVSLSLSLGSSITFLITRMKHLSETTQVRNSPFGLDVSEGFLVLCAWAEHHSSGSVCLRHM